MFLSFNINRQKKRLNIVLNLFCDLAGVRTQDHLLKREVLYQLSYQVVLLFPLSGCKYILLFQYNKPFHKLLSFKYTSLTFLNKLEEYTKFITASLSVIKISLLLPSHAFWPSFKNTIFSPISITEFIS